MNREVLDAPGGILPPIPHATPTGAFSGISDAEAPVKMEAAEAWALVGSPRESLAKENLDWALFLFQDLFQGMGPDCKRAPTTVDTPVQSQALVLVLVLVLGRGQDTGQVPHIALQASSQLPKLDIEPHHCQPFHYEASLHCIQRDHLLKCIRSEWCILVELL